MGNFDKKRLKNGSVSSTNIEQKLDQGNSCALSKAIATLMQLAHGTQNQVLKSQFKFFLGTINRGIKNYNQQCMTG